MSWSGSSGWQVTRDRVAVPPGAVRAVFQIMKSDGSGSIRIDDIQVTAAPNAQDGTWTPFHVADETEDWLQVPASTEGAPAGAAGLLLPRAQARRSRRGGDGQGWPADLRPRRPRAIPGSQPHAADGVPGARAGRRPGRTTRTFGDQPGAARRAGHAPRAGDQPVRRHARRYQRVRPGGPGPSRSSDRRAQAARDLRRAGTPVGPAFPSGRRRRCARPASRRGRTGGNVRPRDRQARDRGRPRLARPSESRDRVTDSPRGAGFWPGSRWNGRGVAC